MEFLLLGGVAFAPAIFWLWYFFRKDKLNPEPLRLIRNSFLWGMAAVIGAGLIEAPVAAVAANPLLLAVVVAPIIEELLKFAVVRWSVYKRVDFDEPIDGVVYATAAALGFAAAENVIYVFQAYAEGMEAVATTSLIRAFLSVPAHALFSAMWGYALGFAKFSDPPFAKKLIKRGLLIAIGFHAVFNLVCLSGPLFALGMLVLVPIAWKSVNRRIRDALAASPHTSLSTTDGEIGE